MQGKQVVIDELNRLLTGELTAADQYFVHSRMYENWGLAALHQRLEGERREELDHAGRLVDRILFLEGVPDVASRAAPAVGATVPDMLRNDLANELAVIGALRKAIALCEAEQDYDTRRILVGMLEETEEGYTHWLEQQIGLIGTVGLQNYLQSAIGHSPGQD